MTKFEPPYLTPKYNIEINESLAYTVRVFDWYLPEDNWLYKDYKRSLRNVTLVSLLAEIENLYVCGATNDQFNEGGRVIYHVLRKENAIPVDEDHETTLNPYACDVFYRSRNCIVLVEGGTISCQECISDDKKSTIRSIVNVKMLVNQPANILL